jgi:hypothetical protein
LWPDRSNKNQSMLQRYAWKWKNANLLLQWKWLNIIKWMWKLVFFTNVDGRWADFFDSDIQRKCIRLKNFDILHFWKNKSPLSALFFSINVAIWTSDLSFTYLYSSYHKDETNCFSSLFQPIGGCSILNNKRK